MINEYPGPISLENLELKLNGYLHYGASLSYETHRGSLVWASHTVSGPILHLPGPFYFYLVSVPWNLFWGLLGQNIKLINRLHFPIL